MKPILIYLAGRIDTNWQDKVIMAFEDMAMQGVIEFFDPRKTPKEPDQCFNAHKESWRQADIVFGYTQPRNPELFMMCVAMTGGFYNKARTIFVDDTGERVVDSNLTEEEKQHLFHLDFLRLVSHKKATSLPEGIDMLKDEIDVAIIRNYVSK